MVFNFEQISLECAKVKVIGVGGAGLNAIRHMAEADITGIEFVVTDTDKNVLKKSPVKEKIQLGKEITQGLGVKGDWELGKKAKKAC
jgi:cell division protein FtsZ